jgi:hypothetical protein
MTCSASFHGWVEEHHLGLEVGQVEVGGGDHGQDARCGQGLTGVDRLDAGVGQRGADVDHMSGAGGQRDVIDVVARAGEQFGVLDALDPVPEDRHRPP